MARNGSGIYSLPAGNPVVTGTTISSTWANTTLSDIASALTTSISSDGQTTPTANLPMGTYAHTNVGNATVRTMYATAGQVEDGTLNYLTGVSGTNAITASAPVGMTSYAVGQVFRFISAGANTSAVTLNLNGIGAKSVVKTDGSALVSGDIASGAAVQVMYDGTNFQLLNDANGQSETVTTLTATTKVVTPQVGSSSGSFTIQSANTTAITVDSSQNVGIGTASPAVKLDVVGTIAASSASAAQYFAVNASGFAAGVANGMFAPAGNTLGFTSAATERMRIDSSGNVGIGRTSTGSKLEVAGRIAASFANSTTADAGIDLVDSSNTGGNTIRWLDSSGYVANLSQYSTAHATLAGVMVTNNGGGYRWNVNGAERMRIDTSGNVSIKTSNAGIIFSNSSALTNSTLNDYETGSWTPTVSSSVGTITSYTSSGIYTKIGNIVTTQISITITNNGTGAGAILVGSFPFTSSSASVGAGRENALTGSELQILLGSSTTTATVWTYSNGYPGGLNANILLTLTYKANF